MKTEKGTGAEETVVKGGGGERTTNMGDGPNGVLIVKRTSVAHPSESKMNKVYKLRCRRVGPSAMRRLSEREE